LKIFKTREFKAALRKKGFQTDRRTGDELFYLFVDGKKTAIHTKTSWGASEDLRNTLMNMIKKQLKLDSKEIESFIACPMEYEQYVEILKKKGVVL
jgi:predicted RNA binding protein YcfA (HicA-like mRNA interferase family)